MADNITLNAGSGGSTLATDDISGVQYQRVKITYGIDGTATDVSSSNPLPVTIDSLAVTGGGVESSALRVTIASDSTGVLSVDDNGGSITVDNDGTFAVQAAQSGAWNVTNVSGTISLPTGAATAAKQPALGTAGAASSDVITVQGIASMTALKVDGSAVTQPVSDGGGSLTVDNAGTFAVQATLQAETTKVIGTVNVAAAQTIAVTNAGTFATQSTLQAGTNAIGKLAANSGVDIGDVDVTSVVPGTSATSLGKAQDSAVGATDTGVAMLAVRADSSAAMTPAAGDYSTLRTDKYGALKTTNLPDAVSLVKYAVIDNATSGDNTIVAAAGVGVKIRVLSVFLMSAGTTTVRFESGASGTALTGQMNCTAQSGFVLPFNPAGWFETATNTLLNLELSAAISVDGCLTYVEV
jgi:hypothetical protein